MDRSAGKAVGEGHEPPGLVDEYLGLNEPEVATADAHLGATCGEDVLYPVGFRPVGKREYVVVASPKHEDRDPIAASARAAGVGQDAAAGQPAEEQKGPGVEQVRR